MDFRRQVVLWRKTTDKIGMEHETQLTDAAVGAFAELRTQSTGDLVFPAPRDPLKAASRYLMKSWWYRAERLAGLKHVHGLGCTGYGESSLLNSRTCPYLTFANLADGRLPRLIWSATRSPIRSRSDGHWRPVGRYCSITNRHNQSTQRRTEVPECTKPHPAKARQGNVFPECARQDSNL